MNTTTRVRCLCPPDGSRHPEGEAITFRERLDFRTALLARKSIAWLKNEDPDSGVPEILALLSEFYLLNCIESWTLRDAKGKPLEVSKTNIRSQVLASTAAFDLADFADDIYTDQVLLPLAAAGSSSSLPSPTNGSTSPTPGNGPSRRPSKRSSIANTRTVATAGT